MVAWVELVTHLASLSITIQTVPFLMCIPLLLIDFTDCVTSVYLAVSHQLANRKDHSERHVSE